MGLRSGRAAKWLASQLITGERPLTRNGRRLQQRARQDEGEAEAGHRRVMPGVGLGRMHWGMATATHTSPTARLAAQPFNRRKGERG